MFNLFKFLTGGSSQRREKYFVYKSRAEKYRALAEELQQMLNEKKKPVLIYIDQQVREELEKVLQAISVVYKMDSSDSSTNEVLVNSFEYSLKHPVGMEYEVRVAECHAHRSKNIRLVESLAGHPEVVFYTSLDNSVFKAFGSERILQLMEQMGMKDNERIEHSLVTKSIIRAQEKLENGERA